MGSTTQHLLKGVYLFRPSGPSKADWFSEIGNFYGFQFFKSLKSPTYRRVLIRFKKKWGLDIDFLHVNTMKKFKARNLASLVFPIHVKEGEYRSNSVRNKFDFKLNYKGINYYLELITETS